MNPQCYPNLEQFFGAWFHQDWAADAATWGDVVEQFKRSEPPDAVLAVIRELDRLLAQPYGETGLRAAVSALGCCYHAAGPARPMAKWLVAVREALL